MNLLALFNVNADIVENILHYICIFLALIIVLPLHEFAHGFAAVKSGDMTPKIYKRYTLNPLAHFDITGLICFVLAGFGWAKPMPVNPNNFKHYKRGCFFVASAGVTMNYILAFVFYPLLLLVVNFVPSFGYFTFVLEGTLFYVCHLSLVFFVFNLLPIYPLDGFRIIDVFSKKQSFIYKFLRHYGIYVLYALMIESFIASMIGIPNILGIAINFLVSYIEIPITAFWGLIF